MGGQLGVALGYKNVFGGFELTLAKFRTSAKLELLQDERNVNLDALIVYAGLALMLEL